MAHACVSPTATSSQPAPGGGSSAVSSPQQVRSPLSSMPHVWVVPELSLLNATPFGGTNRFDALSPQQTALPEAASMPHAWTAPALTDSSSVDGGSVWRELLLPQQRVGPLDAMAHVNSNPPSTSTYGWRSP